MTTPTLGTAGSNREDAAASLLSWLEEEGGNTAGVRVAATPGSGFGVFARRGFAGGEEILRLPTSALLHSEAALADPALRGALLQVEMENRWHVVLLLMHYRRQGPAGRHWPYVAGLPGLEELAPSLPAHWPAEELADLLCGTPVHRQALDMLSSLRSFQAGPLRELQQRWPELFPEEAGFGWAELAWAHAAFWSRAIALQLPGGRRECLVPLLDMCNHRMGCGNSATVKQSGSSRQKTTEEFTGHFSSLEAGRHRGVAGPRPVSSTSHHDVVLTSGSRLAEGEEVCINYGAKGNAELLRCHGFVLDPNPADVYELHLLPSLSELPGDRQGEQEASAGSLPPALPHGLQPGQQKERRGLADGACQRPLLRHFLFHGGLPDLLLPGARLLCALPGKELERALAAARGDTTQEGGEGADKREDQRPGFDWSAVDWAADDPFEACKPKPALCPAGAGLERRACSALLRLLEGHQQDLPAADFPSTPAPVDGLTSGASSRWQLARAYVAGQRGLLKATAAEVRRLLDNLPADEEDCEGEP
mmetsp:Transcript_18468/g.51716  ORF Transcript_18468/g.51716 Transcript_18468/m.51716 type:complete len:536 (+) Transcript_18468:122-1729(+)